MIMEKYPTLAVLTIPFSNLEMGIKKSAAVYTRMLSNSNETELKG